MKHLCIGAASFLGLSLLWQPVAFSESSQTDLCRVQFLVDPLKYKNQQSMEGPLKGCREGDAVHFVIDATRVAYSSIVGRYCNLNKSVVTEKNDKFSHVVCSYQWKWSKDVERTLHPDARN